MQQPRPLVRLRPATVTACLAVLVAFALPAAPASAAAGCPASIVTLSYANGPFSTTADVYDSSDATPYYPAHVALDRLRGSLSVGGSSGGRFLVMVRVVDSFDVTGLPPGTPVKTTLELRPTGQATSCNGHGCGATFVGVVRAGTDSVVADMSGEFGWTRSLPALMSLPLTLVAGSPAEAQLAVSYATGPGGGGTIDVSATWGFTGLPPGARVVSCTGGDLTPARGATWGALKIRYR